MLVAVDMDSLASYGNQASAVRGFGMRVIEIDRIFDLLPYTVGHEDPINAISVILPGMLEVLCGV